MNTPEVSVIVTNYNGAQHLHACFSSLGRLNYPSEKLEVIMVDDASTDDSVEFMRKQFPQIGIVVNPRNLRFTRTVIAGVKATSAPLMAFLNNDTRVEPDWLIELVRPFESDPKCAATSAKMLEWDGSRVNFGGGYLNFEGRGFEICSGRTPGAESSEGQPTFFACGGGMATRREIYEAVGGFDGDFRMTYEDVDYGWRLNLLGYNVMFCPRALMYHRSHAWLSTVTYPVRASFLDRNAYQMLFKNLSDENLSRLLTPALLLSWRRGKALQDQPFRDFLDSAGPLKRNMVGLIRRMLKAIDQRLDINSTDLRAHTDAMDGFLNELPRLIPKREWIQANRQVPDDRIFERFFPHPFRTWAYNDDHYRYLAAAGYDHTKDLMVKIWNLAELFRSVES